MDLLAGQSVGLVHEIKPAATNYPRLGRGGASAHRATTYSYSGRSPGVTACNPRADGEI